jgi:hypothetical protein
MLVQALVSLTTSRVAAVPCENHEKGHEESSSSARSWGARSSGQGTLQQFGKRSDVPNQACSR